MKTEHQKAVSKIRRKLTRTINLHMGTCGHDEDVRLAVDCEMQLLDMISEELDNAFTRGQAMAP